MNTETLMSIIQNEVIFKYFTASGPGGQNLQKNKTGVQLFWNVDESRIPPENKKKIRRVNRTTKEGFLVQFKSQTERSLEMNKKNALYKLELLIERSLYVPKLRKATKPTRAAVKKRLKAKNEHKDRKVSRRNNKVSDWS